jgi:ApaG protein
MYIPRNTIAPPDKHMAAATVVHCVTARQAGPVTGGTRPAGRLTNSRTVGRDAHAGRPPPYSHHPPLAYIRFMGARPFYYQETNGIRITVRPVYLRDQSRPMLRRFVFAYFVRIENVSPQSVQLLSRHWLIHDEVGEDTEVEGEGVVGQQPTIPPGSVHEYQSSCVLKSTHGYMEGQYRFARGDRSRFDAQIPRFTLHADDVTGLFS